MESRPSTSRPTSWQRLAPRQSCEHHDLVVSWDWRDKGWSEHSWHSWQDREAASSTARPRPRIKAKPHQERRQDRGQRRRLQAQAQGDDPGSDVPAESTRTKEEPSPTPGADEAGCAKRRRRHAAVADDAQMDLMRQALEASQARQSEMQQAFTVSLEAKELSEAPRERRLGKVCFPNRNLSCSY